MSALPSPLKSATSWMNQSKGGTPRSWKVNETSEPEVDFHKYRWPSSVRHRMSALKSWLKSATSWMCQSEGGTPRSWKVNETAELGGVEFQRYTWPSPVRHRMSALPSPLKSATSWMYQSE